jgi:3',5'-cyclic AMP phosphodiesterase CpdA
MKHPTIIVTALASLALLAAGWVIVHYCRLIPVHEEPARLKLGFSPDWEYGSRKRLAHKLTNQAPAELEKVVRYFNEEFRPDLVIGGGDYIESSGVKSEKAKEQLREVNDIFKRLDAPRRYALGNHDMRALSKEEVMDILGISSPHSITDIGAWRLVVFDTNFNQADDSHRSRQQYAEGYVSVRELRWLEAAITTDQPTLVFSHHSPIMTYNVDNVLARNIANEEVVRAVLERHSNVVAVISGHTPRPQHVIVNGVHYVIGDTLVNEEGLGAFAAISLEYFPLSRRATMQFEHFGRRREVYHAERRLSTDLILQ